MPLPVRFPHPAMKRRLHRMFTVSHKLRCSTCGLRQRVFVRGYIRINSRCARLLYMTSVTSPYGIAIAS
jgi:hypothetical protein